MTVDPVPSRPLPPAAPEAGAAFDSRLRAVMAGLSVSADPAALTELRNGGVVERDGFRVRAAPDGVEGAGRAGLYRLDIEGGGAPVRLTLPGAPAVSGMVVASAGGGAAEEAAIRRALTADPVLGAAFAAVDRRSSVRLTPGVLSDMQALSAAAVPWSDALRAAKVAKYFAGDPVDLLTTERAVVEVVQDTWLRDDGAIDAERARVPAAIMALLDDPTVSSVRVIARGGMVAVADAGRYSPQEYLPVASQAWAIQRTVMMADDYIVSDHSNLPAAVAASRPGFLFKGPGAGADEPWQEVPVHSAIGLAAGSVVRLPDVVPGRWSEERRVDAVLGEVSVRSQAARYFEVTLPPV